MSAVLTFEPVAFNVVDRNGMPWLRAAEIARALGYSRADQISRIYRAHAREFTDAMTAVVKVPDLEHRSGVAAQTREVRIFSLRGAHLLAMLARTAKAADFRRWVLDVLEGVAHGSTAQLALARLQAAERAEAQSFAAASRGSLALLQRKREKRQLLAAVAQARQAVQMRLQLEGGAA